MYVCSLECNFKFYTGWFFILEFTNPNVTLICSNNTINVMWNPVHNDYDTIEEMIANKEILEYCAADIECDSGYKIIVRTYVRIAT